MAKQTTPKETSNNEPLLNCHQAINVFRLDVGIGTLISKKYRSEIHTTLQWESIIKKEQEIKAES